jgi:hypothetical protein
MGHYKSQRPKLEEKDMVAAEGIAHAMGQEEKAIMFVSWVDDEDTVREYTVNNMVQQHRGSYLRR